MMLDELLSKLKRYTKAISLKSENGSIIVTEYGGRVLAVSIGESPNLLWVNPNLETVMERREFNIGGLRVWVSPERNFFYENPRKFEGWFCPSELDPGEFRIVELTDSTVALESKFKLRDLLNLETLNMTIRRDILLEDLDGGLSVHVRESLIASGFDKSRVCLWALAQVYPGYGSEGTVVIPVKPGAEPLHYFGEIPADRLKTTDSHVAFRIDGEYICKLGVKPEDLRLRGWASIGYIAKAPWDSGLGLLLVMETCCAPRFQDECLDPSKVNPEGPKAAVQSYNSGPNEEHLRFGEIELQFPAAAIADGVQFSTVAYTLKAYLTTYEESLEKLRGILHTSDLQPFS